MGVWSNYLSRQNQQLKDENQALGTARIDSEIAQMGRDIIRAEDIAPSPSPQVIEREVTSLDEINLRHRVASENNQRKAILEHITLEWMLSQRAFKTLATKYGKELGKTYAQIMDEYGVEARAQLTEDVIMKHKSNIESEKKSARRSGITEENSGSKIKLGIYK